MATWSRPWANTTPGEAGPYSDGQWAEMYKVLFQADQARRGVLISDQNDSLAVTPRGAGANMSVDVSAGAALVAGRVFSSDAVTNLAIAAADPSLARIDLVVIRSDASAQTITLAVKTGTPAASPAVPALDTSGAPYYEIPLARIAVAAAASSITTANITDVRAAANVPLRTYLHVTNKSGGELVPGDVVVWTDAHSQAVTTTTTQNNPMVAGVVADVIANDASGRLCVTGLHPVNVAGAVGVGNAIVTSTTAKKATNAGSNSIGRVLVGTTGAGLTTAMIQARAVYPAYAFKNYALPQTTLTNDSTWRDYDATNLSVSLTTHGGDILAQATGNAIMTVGTSVDVSFTIDIALDGVRWGSIYAPAQSYAPVWARLGTSPGNTVSQWLVTPVLRFRNVAPGVHTLKTQYRLSTQAGVTITSWINGGDIHSNIIEAWEVFN